jgi:hypothetical protein
LKPLHRERCSTSTALFKYLSLTPQKRNPPSRFPLRSPYIKMFHFQSPLYAAFKVARKEAPSRFPFRSPYRAVPSPEPSWRIFHT